MNNILMNQKKKLTKNLIWNKLIKLKNQSFIFIDIFIIFSNLFVLFQVNIPNQTLTKTFIASFFYTLLSLILYFFNEHYKLISLYFNSRYFYRLLAYNSVLFFLTWIINFSNEISIYKVMKCWFFISTFMCLSRLFYRDIINHFNVKVKGRIFDSNLWSWSSGCFTFNQYIKVWEI